MKLDVAEYDPRPADLLAFSADYRQPTGWLIRAATWSDVTHIAGVALIEPAQLKAEVRRRHWPRPGDPVCCALNRLLVHEGFERRPLAIESTTLCERPCELTGVKTCGVQAHDPRRRIAEYAGRVWLYRPTFHYRPDLNQIERLSTFLLRHLGAPYDYCQAGLAGTRLLKHVCRLSAPSLTALYCSELWAAALEAVRLFPRTNPSLCPPGALLQGVTGLGSYRLIGEFKRGRSTR